MGESTFNAKDFSPIYSMIDDNSSRLSSKSNEIVSLCEQMAQLIKSEDSDLSSSYIKVGEAFSMAKNKIINLLHQLENEMKLYEINTVTNEEETAAKVKEINANIESILTVFNDIASKNS